MIVISSDSERSSEGTSDGPKRILRPDQIGTRFLTPFEMTIRMIKKKSVILYIDTGNNKKVDIALSVNGKKISKIRPNVWSSQLLVPMIDELLSENKVLLTELTGIRVNTGPGSYTGLRVGIAAANMLAYLLKIPVNGNREQPVTPQY